MLQCLLCSGFGISSPNESCTRVRDSILGLKNVLISSEKMSIYFAFSALSFRITPDESNAVAKVAPEAVQVKKCVEVEAPTSTITQENGPLKEPDVATAAPSPRRGSKLAEKSATARDEDEEVGLEDDKQTGLLQCTLNSPQKKRDSDDVPEANTAPENTNAAPAQDERLDLSTPLLVEAAGLENHTGIEAAAVEEEQSPSATLSVDQEMSSKMDPSNAEASQNCCGKKAAASASCQLPFASLVGEEVESLSW